MANLDRNLGIQLGALLVSLGLALAALIYSSSGHLHVDGIVVWACLPYLAVGMIVVFGRYIDPTPQTSVAFTETSLLILVFSALVYIDKIYFSTGSTSALIFLFAPLWIYFGSLAAFLGSRKLGGLVNALKRRAT